MNPLDLLPHQSLPFGEAMRVVAARWYDRGGSLDQLDASAVDLARRLDMPIADVQRRLWIAYGEAMAEKRQAEREGELLRRMAELRGLHRIIAAANSTLDLETSMSQVVNTVVDVGTVDACAIYIYDRDANELVLRACAGFDVSAIGQIRMALGEGIVGAAGQQGTPLMVADVRLDGRGLASLGTVAGHLHGILAVPIVLFSDSRFHLGMPQLQGVVTVQTRQPHTFNESEISFVETVAGELAFFITNAQMYQQADSQLHRKVRELTTLQQVSKRIAEQIKIDELLQLIAAKAVELSQVDRADILRLDAKGVLQLAANYGAPAHPAPIPTCIGDAVRNGYPLAVLNAFNDSRFPELATTAAHDGFYSLYSIPLRVGGEMPFGAISLYTNQEHHFDFEQVRLLSSFADAAAIAIENARLYDESQRALAVKSVMLQEMHHRVRNNLQTISALLTMQLRRIADNAPAAQMLRDSVARIQAISAVHNLLCREDIGITTVDAIIRQIVDHAVVSMTDPQFPVDFAVRGDTIEVASRQATILAIVLNELVMNALSHGLAQVGGHVEIQLEHGHDASVVRIRDDGPLRTQHLPPYKGSGMGQQMVRMLVESDLYGSFAFAITDGWACATVTFRPIEEEEEESTI
ncbi:MAG: sensor histidine kinase [Chloroflexota bacterium]|jgi:two-component sensor histidine kinase/putative methionine-R-sulfoxide reductase with GAF domain